MRRLYNVDLVMDWIYLN